MSRPRTLLGTSGKTTMVGQVYADGRWVTAPAGTKPTRWRARAKHRDTDGVLRDVERFDTTKGKAETKLRVALTERTTPRKGSGTLRADMSVTDAGALWLAQVQRPDSGLSANTQRQYRDAFARHVEHSTIAGLSLREANRVPVLRGYLQHVADQHGTGSAKTARSVVSGVIGLAVGDGVLDANAMRDVRPARGKGKATERDPDRAFTRAERDHVLAVADSHGPSQHADVADLAWFMAGTGCRVSEALGQRWADIDLQAGTAFIRGTKTEHSQRLLSLPSWLVERLSARAENRGTDGYVFPSPGLLSPTEPRDRRNVARVLRALFIEAGYPWATGHTFRRTVASLLDEAGQPIVLAANYLGHADPAMTARVYLGRRGSTAAAAGVL